MNDPRPLSALGRALLAEERVTVPSDTALRANVMARLATAGLPGFAVPPTTLSSGTQGAPPEVTGAAASASPTGAGLALTKAKLASIVAATYLAGGVTGAIVMRAVEPPNTTEPPRTNVTVPSAAPVEAPAPSTATPEVPAVSGPEELPSVPRRAAPSSISTAAPDTRSDLARERALIDAARASLSRGHPDAALESARRHEGSFPRGQLREERDALRILALFALARTAEARAQERAFRSRYPESLFIPEIEAAGREGP